MRFANNDTRYEAAERQLMVDAVRDTEIEIFRDALDLDDADWGATGNEDEDGRDPWLEDIEGWDGEPLSEMEVANTNLHGFDEDANYDRQVALAADRELLADNAQLRRDLADTRQAYDREFNAPERTAATQANLREQLYQQYGVLAADEAGANRLLNDIAGQARTVQQLNENRINDSMGRAHDKYGDEFTDAFQSLSRASRNDPTAQAIVRDVMNHRDPGERLMEIGYSLGSSRGRGGGDGHWMNNYSRQDSAPSRTARGGRGRIAEMDSDYALDQDYVDEAVERDIANSVWE